jgi:hypothetical protein
MPRGPQGQKRPADVIGNAVRVMTCKARQPKSTAAISTWDTAERLDAQVGSANVGPVATDPAASQSN